MRSTWDAAAAWGSDLAVGSDGRAREQLQRLFHELGAEASGSGACLEIGCGTGRMTAVLAEGWPEVVGVDVSPAMLARARDRVGDRPGVTLLLTDGERLSGVADASCGTVVCFGVVQHLPRRRVLRSLLAETARVLAPDGEAVVQLPVLAPGVVPLVWRAARGGAGRVLARLRTDDVTASPAYRGIRVTARELDRLVAGAGLEVAARAETSDETLYSRYPHARDVRLRLRRSPIR